MNKTVVITGASRGIGRAAALLFASRGCDLAVSCRSQTSALASLCREIQKLGRSCLTFTGDMGDPLSCEAFFTQIRERYSHMDLLINNAGISRNGLFQDMTPEQWQQILSNNISSAFYCSQQAVRMMLPRQSGCILNVSSVWGQKGAACEVAYSATKGAVDSMTKALARELAPSCIRVNAVSFGAIDTDMNAFLTPDEKTMLLDEIPMGRMGTPEEAAQMLWQIYESPAYLTGQIVVMDGGWI